jgi:hypothetical protein
VKQDLAFAHDRFETVGKRHVKRLNSKTIFHVTDKKARAYSVADCQNADFFVVNIKSEAPDGCTILNVES